MKGRWIFGTRNSQILPSCLSFIILVDKIIICLTLEFHGLELLYFRVILSSTCVIGWHYY